jgi:hypothetical protein
MNGANMDQVPLIFTSKGNLPIDSLQYRHEWTNTDEEISFVEEYLLDGEVVKRSVHLYLKRGAAAGAEAAALG